MKIEKDAKRRGVGKTVLIVDDSPLIRRMIADAFLSDGFKACVEAENGKEGIRAAEQLNPDVIILDHSMPVMNGLEAAPKLKRISPNTPIVLFTLYGRELLRGQAYPVEIDLVLPKTTPLLALIEKAHELIGRSLESC